MSEPPAIVVGRRLRKARKYRKVTQAKLAARAGVSRETVYRIEQGRMPYGDTIKRICDALGLDKYHFDLECGETDSILVHPLDTSLRDRRRKLGLSIVKVAEAAGVSAATISRFERKRPADLPRDDEPHALLDNEQLAEILGFENARDLRIFGRRG